MKRNKKHEIELDTEKMDKIDEVIATCLYPKFLYWQQYLDKNEQFVFVCRYFRKYTFTQIAKMMDCSERQAFRYLKSAKAKINKLLP